jgi:endonuclease YncB( thermonuclease family)
MTRVFALIGLLLLTQAALAEVRVVDGDTIEIDGVVYRLNGIDAPEHGQRCGDWRCGADATEAMARLVAGQEVRCETHATDGYGRDIATCYAGARDIGEAMVEGGHAWAFLKYADTYEATQEKAKSLGLGVWSGRYAPPWEFRAAKWQSGAQDAPEGCPIKGNISKHGRIYHTPWSPWYTRTKINLQKGERWFCDEAEAVAAGWRAPYWH